MVLVDWSRHGLVGRGGYGLMIEAELFGCLPRHNELPPRQRYPEALRSLHRTIITVTVVRLTLHIPA